MHHTPSHDDHSLDDVERLFARMDPAPVPDDLLARVLSSTVQRSSATRAVLAWPWLLAAVLALGALALAGYELGASLATGDGLELVGAVFTDFGLLAIAPGDVLAALNEVVPWTFVAIAGLSAALLIVAASNVVSRVPTSLRAQTGV